MSSSLIILLAVTSLITALPQTFNRFSNGYNSMQKICITSDNQYGRCIPLAQCEHHLRTSRHKPSLSGSHECDPASRMHHVCCPENIVIFPGQTLPSRPPTTTPTTSTPPTTPATSTPPTTPTTSTPPPTPTTQDTRDLVHPNISLLPATAECGRAFKNKLIGGNVTDLDEFPWAVLLQYETSQASRRRTFRCGGALINKRYVLTAAHCAGNREWKLISVRLGEHNTKTAIDCVHDFCADPVIDSPVEQIIVHPDFNVGQNARTNRYNDIALLRLGTPLDRYTNFIQPICLPLEDSVIKKSYVGSKLTVTGWGRTLYEARSEVKLKLFVPVVSVSDCDASYPQMKIAESQICAGGSQDRDACSGDSGGPLMSVDLLESDGVPHYHVTGVVSFGMTCSATPQPEVKWAPGVYTRVSSFTPWILDQLRD